MFNRRSADLAARGEYRAGGVSERLVTVLDPTSAATEAYRTLRTNLLYALVDAPPKVIVVTSPGPREGKSTTCANLGVMLAQADKRVLIVDGDLRKPMMHDIFRLRNLWGMVNVLIGDRGLREVWQEPLPGLKVITAGPVPPNPTEFLDSSRFAQFLDQARQEFDYVLIDGPPLGLVSDSMVLAAQGDGVLLVLDAQNTRKRFLRQSIRSLEAVGASILGTVMNKFEPSNGDYRYYRPYDNGYTSR